MNVAFKRFICKQTSTHNKHTSFTEYESYYGEWQIVPSAPVDTACVCVCLFSRSIGFHLWATNNLNEK